LKAHEEAGHEPGASEPRASEPRASGPTASAPKALTVWFVVHCIVDVAFAIPMMIVPGPFLAFMGWRAVDPIATRLVAAALLGIGLESFIGRHSTADGFKAMLNLKIIWSGSATVGLLISMAMGAQGQPLFVWALVAVFLVFEAGWIYWRVHLEQRGA